jgi:uncharacterized protein
MASTFKVKCPRCGAQVAWDESSRFRPFCSERCRTIDLGDWAAERNRIGGDAVDGAADDQLSPPPLSQRERG